jgi:predicted nucleic acid-binding Zn ribbon protein
MKKMNDRPIGEVLKMMVKQNHWKEKLNRVKVSEVWAKVMGETVVRYTRHVTLRKDTLVLLIDSSPLKQELAYAKTKIIKLMNEEIGENVIKNVMIH